jgi:predicted N-acetyltransferase YhbS
MTHGLVQRAATEDDVDQIAALNEEAFGPQDGPDVRTFLSDPWYRDHWSVVADGTRIASSIGRIDHCLQLDGVQFTAAQIEYVVTDQAYQRRGLVAQQMRWHHDRCADEGIVLQLIGGIPYFYRRFGYGYGLSAPTMFLLDRDHVATHRASGNGVHVRDARTGDVDALVALEGNRPGDVLHVVRDERTWRRIVAAAEANEWAHLLVAETGGEIVGWTQALDHPNDRRSFIWTSLARDPDAVTELVWEVLQRAGDHLVIAFDAPDPAYGERLRELGQPVDFGLAYYARIPDAVAFLDVLRPVLSRRLAASQFADATGTLELSLYATGVAIDYEQGSVVAVRSIPGVEDPTDDLGIGVAPDWFPALVLGRWGASELAQRVDDVLILRDRELMDTLFPRLTTDVAGDF